MAKKNYSEEELKLHKQYSKETKKQAVWKNKLTQGFKKWKKELQEQPTEEQEVEKGLETEDVDEVEGAKELEDIEDAIIEVLAEEEEEEIEEVKGEEEEVKGEEEEVEELVEDVEEEEIVEEDLVDIEQNIEDVFTMRKTSPEMQELFESLDAEIRKIKGVNFKTTTLDLVYQTSGMNFLRIRPMVNNLTIMTAPEYYKGIVRITEEKEIDDAMVSVKESYEYIKEKRSKK